MCGICGVVWADAQHPIDPGMLRQMNDSIAHRGPDSDGFWVQNNVGLGARRLKIIDLQTGDQPIANEDRSRWIVFNGEIYNYLELRDELAGRGHSFLTRGDTESILHAYETWGVDCVRHLRGMFAFAIWDTNQRILFLARDRLGKKPLYYYWDGGRLLFGSEIKAILQDRTIPRVLDLTAVDEFLTYGYLPSDRTGFKDIFKLSPGHSLIYRDGKIETREYWQPSFQPDESLSEDDWCVLLLDKLRQSVSIRLMSEVPLGAFLSGGIDSSLVVALMAESSSSRIKTFSIHFEEPDFSEIEYARAVARRYDTEHHEFTVRPNPSEILPELARQFDEPFADSSAIPTFYVSRLAREFVTVALSGDGGDEVFAGYSSYRLALEAERAPRALRSLARSLSRAVPSGMMGRNYLAWKGLDGRGKFLAGNRIFQPEQKAWLCLPEMTRSIVGPRGDAMQMREYDACAGDAVTRMQFADMRTYLPGDILAKVDRTSMLCSLETRCPLLDHELIELVNGIPSALKINGTDQKYILKQVARRLLPIEVLTRRKKGFSVPLSRWLRGELSETVAEILFAKCTQQRGLFDAGAVRQLFDEHKRGRRDHARRLWSLVMLELWQRNFVDG